MVVPDAQVEANVLKALASVPQLADQDITTTTVYGQVTLTGTARDEASRDMAEKLAADAPGVQKVIDQLAIGTAAAQSQEAAATGTNNQVLQSDGTYAPATSQDTQDQGDMNASSSSGPAESAGPPTGGPSQQQGQAQPDGQYRQPYNPVYGQSSQAYSRPYAAQQGGEPVVVPSGTLLRVRVNEGMDSKHTAPGTIFDGVVLSDVIAGNAVAIPRGTAVQGRVVDVQNGGALKGKGELALQLTQITLGGQMYPIVSDAWTHQGADKTGQTVGNAVGLGAVGAMIGAVAGGGPGALLGAGIGGVAGMGASAASSRGESMIPAEAILTFHLTQQVPLTTVSQAEMNRLASGVQLGTQQLQRRYPPPPPSYYGPAY
ncbi:MAG: BON domain-containing protein [Edaphobacter sp.]